MESSLESGSEHDSLELRCVKALFLERQYRQCITTCRNALEAHDNTHGANPLRATFFRFYLALAHDELARAMHNFSHAKVVAFQQAAELYDEALQTLPSAQDCLASIPRKTATSTREPSPEMKATSRHDSLHSNGANDRFRPMSAQGLMPLSPPTHMRNNSLPVRSPPRSTSADTLTSDLDDLESHNSFNDIMTPTRWPTRLERDYSSMSLLQPAQRQMSHHLMRPVRMGSPAKSYHLPSIPQTQQRAQLLRLNTAPTHSSPVRKQLLTQSEQASPVWEQFSPVSPLDSDDEDSFSDTGTISPISPETPWHHDHWVSALTSRSHHVLLEEHLHALQTQIHTHIRLLQTAQQRTLEAKAARTLAHESMFKGQRGQARARGSGSGSEMAGKRMLSERSYWSFTTEEVRQVEKRNRILAAKVRGWRRERFDGERYRELAARALAEL
ncbi:uncharacterized protein LTR77_003875 [Saxophila tyrrhenica]|uniref:Uncharacterized protein n=1 Tax=Saxophila tyrrhenica TaxID=1690608 RepID=A0AAV9PGF7_9PEZI|nr:hypothetical protein LTR77_003875 [Saxophila tyrrhenica]